MIFVDAIPERFNTAFLSSVIDVFYIYCWSAQVYIIGKWSFWRFNLYSSSTLRDFHPTKTT